MGEIAAELDQFRAKPKGICLHTNIYSYTRTMCNDVLYICTYT